MSARLFPEYRREGLVQLFVIVAPVRPRFKPRVFDQLRMLHGVAQSFPELLRRREMNRQHRPVRAGEGIGLRLARPRVRARHAPMRTGFGRAIKALKTPSAENIPLKQSE